jgi:hypothetical protein
MVIPQWTDIIVVDNTLYTKRVNSNLNLKFEIVPKYETHILKEPVSTDTSVQISTDTSVQINIPWQYSQEGGGGNLTKFSSLPQIRTILRASLNLIY